MHYWQFKARVFDLFQNIMAEGLTNDGEALFLAFLLRIQTILFKDDCQFFHQYFVDVIFALLKLSLQFDQKADLVLLQPLLLYF